MARDDTPPADGAIGWLEGELRQTKDQLAKLQHQMEQLQGHLWRGAEEMQRLQEALTAVRIQMGNMVTLQEQARGLTNQTAQLKEDQASLRTALEEAQKQWQLSVERTQKGWGQALRRLEAMEGVSAGAEQRAAAAEAGQQLMRSEMAALQQALLNLERELKDVQGLTARNLEASKRLEQGVGRLEGELESLHRQDDVLAERLRMHLEQMRRLDERLSALAADQTTHEEISQRMDVVRMEGQHLGERLAALEKGMGGQRGAAEDLVRSLDLQGAKLQGQVERLVDLQRQVGGYHQEMVAHLHQWSQLLEKQRRRQLSHLEQELRELKRHELKLSAEGADDGGTEPLS